MISHQTAAAIAHDAHQSRWWSWMANSAWCGGTPMTMTSDDFSYNDDKRMYTGGLRRYSRVAMKNKISPPRCREWERRSSNVSFTSLSRYSPGLFIFAFKFKRALGLGCRWQNLARAVSKFRESRVVGTSNTRVARVDTCSRTFATTVTSRSVQLCEEILVIFLRTSLRAEFSLWSVREDL